MAITGDTDTKQFRRSNMQSLLDTLRLSAETLCETSQWQPRILWRLEEARLHPEFRAELLIDALTESANILTKRKGYIDRKRLHAIRRLAMTALHADEQTLQIMVGLICLLAQPKVASSFVSVPALHKQEQLP